MSRYISNAISEEIVDLEKVNANLRDIEKKARDAADRHNQFLKELGKPPI